MSGRIKQEFIDDLIARIDIVDLIESHIQLKKAGNNYLARCPFHTEKTPSFSVNRSKQFYHCFGCGASGNVISFVMDFNHLDFIEAVEDLADYVGMEVRRMELGSVAQNKESNQDLSAVYTVLRQVSLYYIDQLKRHADRQQVVTYLKRRGVTGEVARDFMIGYAPSQWRELEKKFAVSALLGAGLLANNEKGSLYDRFRGRIMFPIRNRRGQVIGFGGRVLDDSLPKYLNSPETSVFHKSKEVYGLYELLQKSGKPERIVIVEGYMDVIALAQFGVTNVVATLGTAVAQQQVTMLFRFTSELVFCFDGDTAGRQAAWRAVEACLPVLRDGRQVRIMLLKQGADPDSYIREVGTENFQRELSNAETLSGYFFEQLCSRLDLESPEGSATLVEKALPYLQKLPSGAFQELMLQRLRALSGLAAIEINAAPALLSVDKGKAERRTVSPVRTVISLLLQHPDLSGLAATYEEGLRELELPGMELLRQILSKIAANPRITGAGLLEGFRDMPEEGHIKRLLQQEIITPAQGVEHEFVGALEKLIEQDKGRQWDKIVLKAQALGVEALTVEEKAFLAAGGK